MSGARPPAVRSIARGVTDKGPAPFKRNDALLATMPKGLIVFPGSGITENLADKAKRLGVPVWRCGV
ncbi:MAG: hypothetical protein F9K38_10155 [Pseudorhodoplanes sp.]|nr:MAG: hypothetical protein F9K38_10155 [Pseudorhodoplanes sp.]